MNQTFPDREISQFFLHYNSFTMTEWSAEHRSFAIETYFKNSDSIVETLRAFRKKFKILPKKPLSLRETILRWVANFRKTSSALKISPPGSRKWSRTPENVEKARAALIKSPDRLVPELKKKKKKKGNIRKDGFNKTVLPATRQRLHTLNALKKHFKDRIISR
ncbi:hypothetical protein PGB90_002280 [Kerria lacca]